MFIKKNKKIYKLINSEEKHHFTHNPNEFKFDGFQFEYNLNTKKLDVFGWHIKKKRLIKIGWVIKEHVNLDVFPKKNITIYA